MLTIGLTFFERNMNVIFREKIPGSEEPGIAYARGWGRSHSMVMRPSPSTFSYPVTLGRPSPSVSAKDWT